MLELGGLWAAHSFMARDPILASFDQQFTAIDRRSRNLLSLVTQDILFAQPAGLDIPRLSCGECLLRSAAAVEKTFGGITTRLWDDPFEWTLPEKLSTPGAVVDYLDEVEQVRRRGFEYFTSDEDLKRELPAPERLRTLADILLETIATASHFQGRAFAIYGHVSGRRPPNL